MTTLYITRGLPGSGKTTLRNEFLIGRIFIESTPEGAKAGPGVGLSRDDLRAALFGSLGTLPREQEDIITHVHRDTVEANLKAGKTVVVDDQNLSDRTCREWRDLAAKNGAGFHIFDLRDVPLEDCLFRNLGRKGLGGRYVPEEYIVKQYERFIKGKNLKAPLDPKPVLAKGEDFEVIPYVPDTSLPQAFMVDVDGTLAICGDRDIYDGSKAHLDAVVPATAAAVNALAPFHTIIVMTGRQAKHHDVTAEWLYANDIIWDRLFTRADGDQRPDSQVKHDLFHDRVAPFYNVLGVFDDRPSVCRTWRRMGLFTFQVGDPHVEF